MSNDANARDFTEFLSRHLISLCWYEAPVNSHGEFTRRPDFHCASGFLLQVYDTFCLVTAGHVLTDYNKRKKNGFVGKNHNLLDIWSPRAEFKMPTPFDFTDAPARVEDSPERGLDYAVIALPDHIMRSLLKTIEPFTQERLLHQTDTDFEFFAILGTPVVNAIQQSGRVGNNHSVTTYSNPQVIFVKNCSNPPDNTKASEFPQFIGHIQPNETISHMDGTSGGPIFGFRKARDGQLQYWPIAIQSRWLPQSRIVIGTSISIVAQGVHNWISEFISQFDGIDDAKIAKADRPRD
jgi:hypothetical protein